MMNITHVTLTYKFKDSPCNYNSMSHVHDQANFWIDCTFVIIYANNKIKVTTY